MQFRRQHPVGPYILDFYCHTARVAVEVDGAHHGEESQVEHDEHRTSQLAERGIVVLRFSDEDVLKWTDGVVEQIARAVCRYPLPDPPPEGVGTGCPV
jgi:very-short-patch-repair endonuclease